MENHITNSAQNCFKAVRKFKLMTFENVTFLKTFMRQVRGQLFITIFHFVFNFALTITFTVYSNFSKNIFLNRHIERVFAYLKKIHSLQIFIES